MASLLDSQALKMLKSPPNRQEIAEGNDYQSGLRVFTLPLLPKDLLKETAWTRLRNTLQKQLTPDKYKAISNHYTFPMPINNLSHDMLLDLYKVFDGRDASYSVSYPSNNDRAKEMGDVLFAQLDVLNWIKKEGKKVLKCAPNTVVVLDKDSEGNPKILAIPNERITGVKIDSEGNFEIFMFVHSKGVDENEKPWIKYGYYDAFSYRVFTQTGGDWVGEPVTNPHTLGSCPARWFYDNPRVDKHHFDRAIPFTSVLGVMEDWQTIELFDTFQYKWAGYQVLEYPLSECDNASCTNGVITIEAEMGEGNKTIKAAYDTACPSCAKNAFMGPGTAIGIAVSELKEDQDTRGVVRFVAPDIEALKASGEKNAERENAIKNSVVGYSANLTKTAINEVQVGALVESRKLVLFDIKHHLEDLYKWIVGGYAKIMFNIDVSVHANYGTEFFILTASDIVDLIEKAKKAGVQASFIAELNRTLIYTKFKSDPRKVERMLISADLEPNPYDSQEEARSKFKESSMNAEDYFIKSNFNSLLREWEIENGDIVSFAPQIKYSKKIEKIKKDLLMSARDKMPQEKPEDDATESASTSGERA